MKKKASWSWGPLHPTQQLHHTFKESLCRKPTNRPLPSGHLHPPPQTASELCTGAHVPRNARKTRGPQDAFWGSVAPPRTTDDQGLKGAHGSNFAALRRPWLFWQGSSTSHHWVEANAGENPKRTYLSPASKSVLDHPPVTTN